MKIILMQGISGSGKSTWAINFRKQIEQENRKNVLFDCFIISADDFFMIDGNYKFDPLKLKEAHAKCMKTFINYCQNVDAAERTGEIEHKDTYLIVDNTSLSVEEIMPYYTVGKTYGHDVEVKSIKADLKTCIQRNTHEVPPETVGMQFQKLISCHLPNYIIRTIIEEAK